MRNTRIIYTLFASSCVTPVGWKAPYKLRVCLGASFGLVDDVVHRVKLQLFLNKNARIA